MDGGAAESQSPLAKRLEQKHAEARRPDHRHGSPGEEWRQSDGRAEGRLYRRAGDSQHGIASRFFQMRLRAISLSRTGVLFFAGALLLPALHAQAPQPHTNLIPAPADFTGVWYP